MRHARGLIIVCVDSEEADTADDGGVKPNTNKKQSTDGAKKKPNKKQGELCCQNSKHM
jgi:hypothetical protein